MDRTRFIEQNGRRVVLVDLREIRDPAAALREIRRARAFFAVLPEDGSLLTLTRVEGSVYNSRVLDALLEVMRGNRERVRAAAVTVRSAVHRAALAAVARASGREMQLFENGDAALDWLLLHEAPQTGASPPLE